MSEYFPSNNLIAEAIGASQLGSPGAQNACSLSPTNAVLIARLTRVTVSASQVTGVVSGLVTITGLSTAAGGTLNYYFVETVSAGGWLDIPFDPPLPASGANVSIVVTLAAIASGSSSAITLNGWQA